jgi:hypothetical protein
MKSSAADPWSLSWETACTLTELGELTARWLTGELAEHPAYGGTPEEETKSMVDLLAGVNRAGLLTDFSQPGVADPGNPQRAAVAGYCDEVVLKRLLVAFAPTDLVLLNEYADSGIRLPVSSRAGKPCTFVGGKHGPDGWDRALSDVAMAVLEKSWYVAIIDPRRPALADPGRGVGGHRRGPAGVAGLVTRAHPAPPSGPRRAGANRVDPRRARSAAAPPGESRGAGRGRPN